MRCRHTGVPRDAVCDLRRPAHELDGAIANIALPTIARDLQVGDAATVWVVNAYNVGSVICLLPAAALGEIFD